MNRHLLPIITGIFIFSGSFILQRFVTMNDFVNGIVKGTAIGMMVIGVIQLRRKGIRR
ncbi:MAG: hypothetical protein ACO1OO_11160 [Flavisolibacter sp.]